MPRKKKRTAADTRKMCASLKAKFYRSIADMEPCAAAHAWSFSKRSRCTWAARAKKQGEAVVEECGYSMPRFRQYLL
jgi:hypothetical protein